MDRKGRGGTALSATLFSRSEPYREGLGKTQTNASRGKGTNQRNTRSGHHRRASTHHSSQCKSLLQTHPLTVYSKTENTLNMDFIAFGLAGKLKIVPQ